MEDEFEVDTSGRPGHTLLAVVKVSVHSPFLTLLHLQCYLDDVRLTTTDSVSRYVWQLLLVSERGYSLMRDCVMTDEGTPLACV